MLVFRFLACVMAYAFILQCWCSRFVEWYIICVDFHCSNNLEQNFMQNRKTNSLRIVPDRRWISFFRFSATDYNGVVVFSHLTTNSLIFRYRIRVFHEYHKRFVCFLLPNACFSWMSRRIRWFFVAGLVFFVTVITNSWTFRCRTRVFRECHCEFVDFSLPDLCFSWLSPQIREFSVAEFVFFVTVITNSWIIRIIREYRNKVGDFSLPKSCFSRMS